MGAYAGRRDAIEGLDGEWRGQAACADRPPHLWFSDDGRTLADARDRIEAKTVCRELCPVVDECLEFALAARIDDGIWGGYDPKERRAIIKQRRKLAATA